MENETHLPVLVDPRFVRALDHVLRQHILLAAVQGEVSPKELSVALDEGLSQVSYHVKVLRDDCDGMIEETRTEPRRGAIEHYYRATAKSLLPAKTWRRLKKGLRAVVGAGQANDLFNDLVDALKAGKLQGTHDHISRSLLVLDPQGERNVKAIAERATKEVEDEQQAAAKRMQQANGDGSKATGYTFALLAFEAAWEPVNLHPPSATQADNEGGRSANGTNGADRNGGGRQGSSRRKAQAARK
ncbi:MAG TPA: winged helix-turn-helix domain-containing protein [Solirubrobacterales bacterium]